jgi:hypothetical protein
LIRAARDSGSSGNKDDFRWVFICRAHEVLEGAYRRLAPAKYRKKQEPAVTGAMREEMNNFLRDVAAPDWADYFSIHDDPPIEDDEREGRDRNRIDIRVDTSRPRPGMSFLFEAKRLARGYAVGKYLGDEGLGCFLCGDYARDDDDAGMLGYMQDHDAAYWSRAIEATIQSDPDTHGVDVTSAWWEPFAFEHGPVNCFASGHARKGVGRPIKIYHSLLMFQ